AFINRTDCYHLQRANGEYTRVRKPLTPSLITAHLKGAVTLGAYALDADSNGKWLCFDADTDERFGMLVDLAKQLEPDNVTSYLELSRRGGHLWLFTPTMSGNNIRRFGKQLMSEYQLPDDMELYP